MMQIAPLDIFIILPTQLVISVPLLLIIAMNAQTVQHAHNVQVAILIYKLESLILYFIIFQKMHSKLLGRLLRQHK